MLQRHVGGLHVYLELLQCCSVVWEANMYTWGCCNVAASCGRFACTPGVSAMLQHHVGVLHVHLGLLQCGSVMWEVCMYTWGCWWDFIQSLLVSSSASSIILDCRGFSIIFCPMIKLELSYSLSGAITVYFIIYVSVLTGAVMPSWDSHRLPLESPTSFCTVTPPFPHDSLYVSISCQHSLLFQHTQDNQLIRKKGLLWLLVSEYIRTWFHCTGPVVAKQIQAGTCDVEALFNSSWSKGKRGKWGRALIIPLKDVLEIKPCLELQAGLLSLFKSSVCRLMSSYTKGDCVKTI